MVTLAATARALVLMLILILILILSPGVDYRGIGLRDLRKAVSYLGQEPVVFSGTLRKNFDFYGQREDQEIWEALTSCHCSDFISSETGALNDCIEGNKNFSVGVTQLFNLARVVLERRKVFFSLLEPHHLMLVHYLNCVSLVLSPL